jgi:hypothetical protein
MSTRKIGRPAYAPSPQDRETVEQMRFCGESESVIATVLTITIPTLRKHFREELDKGAANRRREVIGLLFETARKGNVSAQKKLEEMGRIAGAAASVKAREPKAPTLGKKEVQTLAAKAVSGKFAPPEPPKLVINNR